jgi:KDO2-lipid IV(A) lauroyltransferase
VSLPRRRGIALANLERAFGRAVPAGERRRIGRRSFQHFGMTAVETCALFLRPPAVLLSRVAVDGLHNLKAAASEGKGVLALTGHYGNWELLAFAHALCELPTSVVVRPLDQPASRWLVDRLRGRTGAEVITKRRALRDIVEALHRGRMVGILLDQNAARSEGVFAPFFGVPASTSRSLAVISLRTGAPVVPVFIRREAGGRHLVEFAPAVPPPADGSVEGYTAAFNARIEDVVRRAPEQWFWMHDRWRTRPAGEPRTRR